jgi:hypothetical protein
MIRLNIVNQPCCNISLPMQNTPDIHMIITLYEENQVWVAGERPEAQARNIYMEALAVLFDKATWHRPHASP